MHDSYYYYDYYYSAYINLVTLTAKDVITSICHNISHSAAIAHRVWTDKIEEAAAAEEADEGRGGEEEEHGEGE